MYPLKQASAKATPIFSLHLHESFVESSPITVTFPAVGLIKPRIALIVVLLPEPFCPVIA